jgi:hypothetical protein
MKNAGKDLDIEIAKKIFNYIIIIDTTIDETFSIDAKTKQRRKIENFSSNIDDAYTIITKLSENGFLCNIKSQVDQDGVLQWYAGFFKFKKNPNDVILYQSSTLPLAICNAALKIISEN